MYQGFRQISVRLFINKILVRNITVEGRPQKTNNRSIFLSGSHEKNFKNLNLTFFNPHRPVRYTCVIYFVVYVFITIHFFI